MFFKDCTKKKQYVTAPILKPIRNWRRFLGLKGFVLKYGIHFLLNPNSLSIVTEQ